MCTAVVYISEFYKLVGKPLFEDNFQKVPQKKNIYIYTFILQMPPNTEITEKNKVLNKRNVDRLINGIS